MRDHEDVARLRKQLARATALEAQALSHVDVVRQQAAALRQQLATAEARIATMAAEYQALVETILDIVGRSHDGEFDHCGACADVRRVIGLQSADLAGDDTMARVGRRG